MQGCSRAVLQQVAAEVRQPHRKRRQSTRVLVDHTTGSGATSLVQAVVPLQTTPPPSACRAGVQRADGAHRGGGGGLRPCRGLF